MSEPVADALRAARAALEARAGEVDDLNVFPVADGDTGTNMLLTAVAVERSADATSGLPRADRCRALARAALLGARGNSGMILSQLVRGAAEALAGREGALDAAALRAALRGASDAAYAAVREPVEGTMLTVARRAAEAAESARGDRDAVLEAAVGGARSGVEETPELLPLLREAGVVDAGGLGVALLLEGIAAAIAGREPPGALTVAVAQPARVDHPPSRYRYCTSFLVEGEAVDAVALEAALVPDGDSLLVMGDARQVKVHVHTDAPERAAALAGAWGVVGALRVDDMRRQEAERAARLRASAARPGDRCGALAIADGEGVRALMEGLGAATLPPAGGDEAIAAALAALGTPEAVVLIAEGGAPSAAIGGGPAVVRPGSLPAALACLVALDPSRGAGDNAAAMQELARAVVAVEVDGGDPDALREGLRRALADTLGEGPALVTVLVGARAGVEPSQVEAWVREVAGATEVEVDAHHGGQAAPALAIGVE